MKSMSKEFLTTYNKNISYEIKNIGICPKCDKNMSILTSERIYSKNKTKNILCGVGCDHTECQGCPIKFGEKYYKCNNCSLDFCQSHAEKCKMENIVNLEDMKNYLKNEFTLAYNY